MSDEQTIYISPDDDLTNVRERLEQLPSRRITLVIPNQSQLRSHVAWNLLHKRAREMGKDILIVSSDPQIRSVAQAAKFRVAHSLEAPVSGRSRPASRPGRSTRGAGSGSARSRRPPQPQQWADERTTLQPGPTSGTSSGEETTTAGPHTPLPSSYDAESRYERPYDFRHDAAPHIQPLAQEQLEEEPDLLLEDYRQAQDIRQAAQRASERQAASTPERAPVTPGTPPGRMSTPVPDLSDDPFAYMEDLQPPPSLKEQLGSVQVQDYDSDEHPAVDIAEMPTSVIENQIEYRSGDRGDFVSRPVAPPTPAPRSWAAPAPTPMPAPEREPVRASGAELEEDALPPVEERPTQEPLPSARPAAAAAAAGATSSKPLQLPETPSRRVRRTPRLASPAARSVQPRPAAAASRRPTGASRPAPARRGGVSSGAVAIVVLVALLLGALAYFGPSTNVTITMLSRNYSHQIKLTTLTGAGTGAAAPGTVRAVTLTHMFSKDGMGTATSNTEVGNVIFTNNGSSPIEIPTGTTLATTGANSTQFVTTADAVVPAQGSSVGNTIQVPVRAQQPGAAGHADSGTITVITSAGLQAIAQANNISSPASLKLSVTNSAPTATGAGGPAIITAQDLDNAKKTLHGQLQSDITAWEQHNLAPGDVVENVSTTDTLANAPREGQLVDQGTFPVTLNVAVSVQIVRSLALQAATVAELNADMSSDKAYKGYMAVVDQQHPLLIPQKQIKIGGVAPVFTLTFPVTAKVVPDISSVQVQRLIVGRPLKDARNILMGIRGVQKADIRSTPGFDPWVALWTGHITVHFVPGTSQISPKV